MNDEQRKAEIIAAYQLQMGQFGELTQREHGRKWLPVRLMVPWPPDIPLIDDKSWIRGVGERLAMQVTRTLLSDLTETTPESEWIVAQPCRATDAPCLFQSISDLLSEMGAHNDQVFLIGNQKGLWQGLAAARSGASTVKIIEDAWGPCQWIRFTVPGHEDHLLVLQGRPWNFWADTDGSFRQPRFIGPYYDDGQEVVRIEVDIAAGHEGLQLGRLPLVDP